MKKRKVLIMSDSYQVWTGFADQARNISNHLHNTGKYEVAYLGWFYAPLNNINPPFTFYTTLRDHKQDCCSRGVCIMKVEPNQPPVYMQSKDGVMLPMNPGQGCLGGHTMEHDKYAFESMHGIILDFKPDIIFTLGDTWMTYHTQFMDVKPCYKWISYTPIDGSPMPNVTEMGPQVIDWVDTIDKADTAFAFCDFGRDAMMNTAKKAGKDLTKVQTMPHGCDVETFKPLSEEEKIKAKKEIFGLDKDVFLIGCFSRNQPRKAFHKLMEALALGKKRGYWDGKKIKCYFHCPIKDVGWNLPGLIKWHGLEDIIILNDKLGVGAGPTTEELNRHYNACDLMTLPSRGEGWGLTYSEAMAAGIPVLMSSYSAHHDWAGSAAARIKILCVDAEPITNIDRGIVDVDDYCEKIKAFFDNITVVDSLIKFPDLVTDYKGNTGEFKVGQKELIRDHFIKNGRQWIHDNYRWEVVLGRWEKVFDDTDTSKNHMYPEINLPKQVDINTLLDKEKKDRILYVMPGTWGDVFLSTAVCAGIKEKYPEKDIYFITHPHFKSILDGNKSIYKVIDFNPIFINTNVVNQLFDIVFHPFTETQAQGQNWTRNGKGRHLAEVYANHCDVTLGKQYMQIMDFQDAPDEEYVAIHVKTGQPPKDYMEYQKVVDRLDIKVVQIGSKDDKELKGALDLRGCAIQETAGIIKKAKLFIGGDSICSHIAGYVGTDSILLYASTFPSLTAPIGDDANATVVEPTERFGCDRPCHLAQCVRGQRSCIDTITPTSIIDIVKEKYKIKVKDAPKPEISGYTTTFNPDKYYPWRESIKSMLPFCEEVVVVDGGSKDGTLEELKAWAKDEKKLKVFKRRWRDDEPMMDGKLKAMARAMCTKEFCWQQDADEIVHENDYDKIINLASEFPSMLKMAILPVIDLYGSTSTVRTDKGLYKWRLSRNLPEITHGIPSQLRLKNEAGKIYCDPAQCDGCFPINTETGQMIDNQTSFFGPPMQQAMQEDTPKYKELMTAVYKEMPSPWHFSWHNLERRIKVDLAFWDQQWATLGQGNVKPENRFIPGVDRKDIDDAVIQERADYLATRTLDGKDMDLLKIDWAEVPAVVKPWLEKYESGNSVQSQSDAVQQSA